ncbi:hypothetical protein [Alteromonas macleodii]|uniref:Uncharacterized protein n=1 Tax=Alteromonas macleodii TaxID=28108 RepID=A0AB36FPB1_ALTMA|nr:hypothetical protein [Alteromonas macleodii]OES23930.1 hypothetical protein BFV94_4978 [Alteromonas macleodii]OES24108.1 hypothetical protein BFV93_4861 [Alteromonas macleodii]OES25035.1 hypothetical protein BFV95_4503 [Alteromonas macleodii]OES38697.1 hypothetical protein BFV96_4808 [Alteromonas macleodii]
MNIEEQFARIKRRLNVARYVVAALALCCIVTTGSLALFPDYLTAPTVRSDILFESEEGLQRVSIQDIHWKEFSSLPTFTDPDSETDVDLVLLYDTGASGSGSSAFPAGSLGADVFSLLIDMSFFVSIMTIAYALFIVVQQEWQRAVPVFLMGLMWSNLDGLLTTLGIETPGAGATATISVPVSQHPFVLAQTGLHFESMDMLERYVADVPINSLSTYEGLSQLIALENTVGLEGNKELRETHRIESERRHDAQQTTLLLVRIAGSVLLIGFVLSSAVAFLILLNFRTLKRYIKPADTAPSKPAHAAKAA